MLNTSSLLASLLLLMTLSAARAQEYSLEVIDAAPQADEVSDEISKLLDAKGIRVMRGATRNVCEIWLCKPLQLEADFQSTAERLYPFTPGQLIGLLYLPRKGAEFRDQSLASGWYTLRFGLQPIDGNHVGTSPTRDFVLLVDAAQDPLPETWDPKELQETSAEAAGSSHPALMCMQKASGEAEPAIRHEESNDWWVLHMVGKGTANGKAIDIPIDLVVVGHATE